ncbi:hypothetical protein AMS68_007784 [Peltaster fructicola]|uniref:Fibronectin type-III domain-containing protein n=1 Tax=Peltaster fructicola TaxID=286661 RepID=A0A6H0Y5E1_9PEZI|nr:hypothetical protein AMS68_007784 [Peltaster fructicola]
MSSENTGGMRLMIVGDSMTQGGSGDWTWRYRLWKWLKDEQVNVTFTGPYIGTQQADEPSPPRPPPLYKSEDPPSSVRADGGYAKDVDEDFDSHHYSTWGRQCAQSRDVIEEIVSGHPTDLLLVMLGFNDIGWFVSDAKGTLESMTILVHNARKANPRLKFAIANIPQRTYMDGREDLPRSTKEYNELLVTAITKWTTKESPIHLVKLAEEYVASEGSYDGLHPNALGEYQIARAFSITLVDDFKLGLKPLAVPEHIPTRPLPSPSHFELVSSPAGVTATWDTVYGTYGYEFRSSVDDGEFSTDDCHANRWDSHWAHDGQVYRAQVRSRYGERKSKWTPVLSAMARPQLAAPPENVKVISVAKGVIVSWDRPHDENSAHIIQYTIFWKDKESSGFPALGGFKHSPAHIDELEHGHRYDIWMATWTIAGEGMFGPMQEVTVGHDGSLAEEEDASE